MLRRNATPLQNETPCRRCGARDMTALKNLVSYEEASPAVGGTANYFSGTR